MLNNLFLKGARIDWSKIKPRSYLRGIHSISSLNEIRFSSHVTFFVGENGSGKSTLLEALAISFGFNPEGGTKNYSFSTCDSHSELCDAISTVKGFCYPDWGYFLRAESFYNVATKEMAYSQGYNSEELHKKSHGESFLSVMQKNFKGNGLYFLDEPEAALSPQRQLTLLIEIQRSVREGSQFIIVTHSPILLGLPDAEILSFDGDSIAPCRYEDTDSYKVTKMFLSNRDALLRNLLE